MLERTPLELGFTLPALPNRRGGASSTSPSSFNSAISRRLKSMINTHDASIFIDAHRPEAKAAESSKTEQLRQISTQLSFLRKKHDFQKTSNIQKEVRLAKLNRDIVNFSVIQSRAISQQESLKQEVKSLQQKLKVTIRQQQQAASTGRTYQHIIQRMRLDQLNLQKINQAYNKKLRAQQQVLLEQTHKQRKTREDIYHAKEALKALEVYVEREIRDREIQLVQMEHDAAQKKELTIKREQRERRQAEISEAAANQHRNKSAIEKRQGLMLHRMWFNILKTKHLHLLRNFSSFEEAFAQAKTSGQIGDISDMVSKLLTREKEYSELIEFVVKAKQKVKNYSETNQQLEKKVQMIQKKKVVEGEFDNLRDKIAEQTEINSKLIEKQEFIKIVYGKVGNWMLRTVEKLESIVEQTSGITQNSSVTDKIEAIRYLIMKVTPTKYDSTEKQKFQMNELLSEIPEDVRKALTFVTQTVSETDEEDEIQTARRLEFVEAPVPVARASKYYQGVIGIICFIFFQILQ